MNAVGYVRVSTVEQRDQGISPEAQVDAIEKYCDLKGFDLVHLYRDLGVSAGKPLNRRKQGAELLDSIEAGEAQVVVAIRLDRLFRNAVDCLNTTQAWDKADVALHLINQGGTSVDTKSAMGRFLLTIMAGMAEMERNLISERVSEALDFKKSQNERTGTVPYGYEVWPGDGKKLIPNKAEQAVIEHILELREAQVPYRRIADTLNAQSIPSRGEKGWTKTTIWRLVKREVEQKWRPGLRKEDL